MIGKKRGMTRLFDEKTGKVIPCTVVEVQPNVVTQIKTKENDGYAAIQLASIKIASSGKRNVKKPQAEFFSAKGIEPRAVLRETRDAEFSAEVGKEVSVEEIFVVGALVDVSGTSKGKGYQGVIKRHNKGRIVKSHGAGPVVRHIGSSGSLTAHGRVQKNKRMAGHMGNEKVTTECLEVLKVDPELKVLVVKGAIPGPNGGVVAIRNSIKGKAKRVGS
jgi:large subunit ribosomal protein L3